MRNQADQSTPGQIGHPSRAGSGTKSRNPLQAPVLRPGPCGAGAECGQIIQPAKTMDRPCKSQIRGAHRPDRLQRGLDQIPPDQEISGHELLAAQVRSDGARFRRRLKRRCQLDTPGPPRVQSVHQAQTPRRPALDLRHARTCLLAMKEGSTGLGLPFMLGPIILGQYPPVTGKSRAVNHESAVARYRTRRSRHGRPSDPVWSATHPRR